MFLLSLGDEILSQIPRVLRLSQRNATLCGSSHSPLSVRRHPSASRLDSLPSVTGGSHGPRKIENRNGCKSVARSSLNGPEILTLSGISSFHCLSVLLEQTRIWIDNFPRRWDIDRRQHGSEAKRGGKAPCTHVAVCILSSPLALIKGPLGRTEATRRRRAFVF